MPPKDTVEQSAELESVPEFRAAGTPTDETERARLILSLLMAECAAVLDEDLSLVEPVGTFHPEER